MSSKLATNPASILIILLLVFLNLAIGCTGTPSEEDMGEVIFDYITRSASGFTDKPCNNPQAVEVIEVEEASEQHSLDTWTVTVNVICSNEEVQAEYVIFKDTFGNIKVLRRSA